MDSTRHARIKAAHNAHTVDALEVVFPVFLEDRGSLHRIFVGTWNPIHITRAGIPWSRRIWMIIGNLAVPYNDVVRQRSPNRLMETTSDGVLCDLEFRPPGCSGRVHLPDRF